MKIEKEDGGKYNKRQGGVNGRAGYCYSSSSIYFVTS